MKLPDLSNPLMRLRFGLYAGAVAIVGLFAVSIGLPAVSNPVFCGKACHNMNPQYQTWQKSSHSRITCYACHVDRSYVSLMKEKFVVGAVGIVHTVTNSNEKPINAESEYSQLVLPSARCERCHSNENRKFTFSRGLYMDHLAHKNAEIQCPVCHNRVVHKGAESYEPLKSEWDEEAKGFKYKDFLTMKDGCFRCHDSNPNAVNHETLKLIKNGKKPPTACTTCHTKDFQLPLGHQGMVWRSEHGPVAKQDFGYCFSCHDGGAKFDSEGQPWCILCHDAEKIKGFKQQQAVKQ